MDLKDKEWTVLESLIPRPKVCAGGRGRPWRDDCEVLNGILWMRVIASQPDFNSSQAFARSLRREIARTATELRRRVRVMCPIPSAHANRYRPCQHFLEGGPHAAVLPQRTPSN